MNPLDTVKPSKDTTYFLMWAAFSRGHEVYSIDQNDLEVRLDHTSVDGVGELFTKVTPVDVIDPRVLFRRQSQEVESGGTQSPFDKKADVVMSLAEMDVVWVRTDPPFDRRYFYTTLLLDLLPESVLVLNRPDSLRNWNEKISALFFSQYTPKTLITSGLTQALEFLKREKKAVLKPIDGFGGKGISILDASELEKAEQKIQLLIGHENKKIILQQFVPEADQGDKRILLVDGEPIGAILRVAGVKGGLNNLDQGGSAHASELSERERQICAELGPRLKKEGLFFVGIDMLGDYLTEINVTSPTGLQEMSRFLQKPLHIEMIKKIEGKVNAR